MQNLITERALVQRLKRSLYKELRFLYKTRPNTRYDRPGYFMVENNTIYNSGLTAQDLLEIGKERGIVHPNEALAEA